jgi:hypothetical protein
LIRAGVTGNTRASEALRVGVRIFRPEPNIEAVSERLCARLQSAVTGVQLTPASPIGRIIQLDRTLPSKLRIGVRVTVRSPIKGPADRNGRGSPKAAVACSSHARIAKLLGLARGGKPVDVQGLRMWFDSTPDAKYGEDKLRGCSDSLLRRSDPWVSESYSGLSANLSRAWSIGWSPVFQAV